MNTVMYVGKNTALVRRLSRAGEALKVLQPTFDTPKLGHRERVDLVLYDLEGSQSFPALLRQARRVRRPASMLIVGSAALLEKDDAAKQWVRKRNADFIRADAPTGEFLARMEAVISRVESLRAPTRRPFARRVGALDIPPSSAPDGEEDSQKTPFHGEHAGAASNLWSDELRQRLFAHIVPELRSNRSQRLDARQVTDFFGLTLADVARVLGRPPSSVHRTPDAPSLQEGLEIFERMASALLKLAGSWELARLWLNARNAALDMAPIDAIRQGHGRVVIGLLEDALMGMPT